MLETLGKKRKLQPICYNRRNFMKRIFKIVTIIIIVVIIYFSGINTFNYVFCKAQVDNEKFTIKFDGKIYYPYNDIYDYIVLNGEPSNITGVLTDSFLDYVLFPREYIYHLNEIEDVNTSFIVYESITPIVFVEENFKFPNIKDNIIEAVWFSWDTDLDIVQDENIVNEFVMCALNGENRPLNKQLYEMVTEYDGNSCYIKFKDYPITANFEIKTKEDGTFYLKEQDGCDKYTVFLDQNFLNELEE